MKKMFIIFCLLFIVISGCSKDNNITQPEGSIITGTWEIQSLAINDTIMNFNDMSNILRKVVINDNNSSELHWYDKLNLDGIEVCTWVITENTIIFTVSIPNETWSYEYSYILDNTVLTLSRFRNNSNWTYKYKK